MYHVLKLHHGDLSTETLVAIRNDLAKYAHLKAYEQTWQLIVDVIAARKLDEKEQRKRERGAMAKS